MGLEFLTTAAFQNDLTQLEEPTRKQVVQSVDRRGQLAITDREAFQKGLIRPGLKKLAGGLDASLYAMRVGKDLRVIFALDDDPIFDRTILTLLRVVQRDQAEEAYEKTAQALYGERLLNGKKEERKATAARRGKQTATRSADKAAS
jgi:mRNA-degrading endonuclease RelE of RelBE toxin-antitoxin system